MFVNFTFLANSQTWDRAISQIPTLEDSHYEKQVSKNLGTPYHVKWNIVWTSTRIDVYNSFSHFPLKLYRFLELHLNPPMETG